VHQGSIIPKCIIPKCILLTGPAAGRPRAVAPQPLTQGHIGGMFEPMNPFKYGRIVTGDDFVDREREIAEIVRDVRNGLNVVLYSHRRMGKSSLLAEITRRYSKEFIFVYVDLYGITTRTKMVEVFMTALVGSTYGTLKKAATGLAEILKGSRFRLVISEKGEPGIELAVSEPSVPEFQDVLDMPERIARKRGRRIVVMFDEFQEIGALDGPDLLKLMRSRFQSQEHVSYIFAGSKKHLLLEMFEEREGAFFKSARSMELGPIPTADFEKFLVKRFHDAGGRLNPEIAKRTVEVSLGNSYYVQQLAYELFNISQRPSLGDLESAVSVTLAHQSPAFSFLWDSVKSRMQRRYLIAAAREPDAPRGADYIERYRLRSAAHVQRCVKQLDARGVTERGRIVDPMLRLWLRHLSE